jgi:hypothetical protein
MTKKAKYVFIVLSEGPTALGDRRSCFGGLS